MMKRNFTQLRYAMLLLFACCTASTMAQQFVTIPTANTNTASARPPFGNWWGFERSAQIYLASEIGKADTVKSVAFYVNSLSSPAASTPIKIYLKERATNTFAATSTYASEISGAKLVFTGNVTSAELAANQWVTKTLDSAFYFSNTQALEVIIETNGGGGGIEGQFAKQFRLSASGGNRAQNWTADTNPPTGTGTLATNRPNIIFGFPPPPPCTGTPVADTTFTTASAACSGTTVGLSLSGSNIASGITYQWQSSIDSITFADINAATNATYTATITATTYYRSIVTCTVTGFADTSAPVKVTLNSYLQCYCTPASSTCTASDRIDSVNFAGIVSASATGCSANGYVFYSTPVGSATKGVTYPISVKVGPGGTEYVGVWIDYDHSGTFDASEFKLLGSGNGVVITNTIAIPAGALSGNTRVRVRVRYNTTLAGTDACTTIANGETEDYLIDIQAPPVCTGAPTAGTTQATANPACAGQTTTLSITGVNQFDGITYQWITSTDGVNYTLVNAANAATYAATFTGSVYYRNIVTCTNSGQSDTSSVLQLTAAPFIDCYCVPTTTDCTDGDRMDSVNFAGIISSATGCNATTGYASYTTPVGSVTQGLTYPIAVKVSNGGTEYVGAWIDYDHSGTFDSSEYKLLGSGNNVVISNTITIPVTSLTGQTKIRLRVRYNTTLTATQACAGFTIGETEDYLLNILPQPQCTAAVAGTTTTSANPACANQPITVNISGGSTDAGISYQWISSTDGINYTPIQGATSASYTGTFTVATYYRNIVSCSFSSTTDTSSVLYVTVNSFENCYCTPTASDCTDGDRIDSVAFAGINRASVCSANGYSFTTTPVGFAYKTVTYPIGVKVANGGTEHVAIWIDYDHSGTFDTSEFKIVGSGNNVFITNTVTIPANALTGITRVRIRDRFNAALPNTGACLAYGFGETEDYLIDIQEPPACTNPPVAGAVTGDSTVCAGNTTLLTLSGADLGTALQWQTSTDSTTWTNVAGATTSTLTTDTINATRFYRVRVTCIDSTLTTVFAVRIAPSFECYCSAFTQDCTDGDVIVNVDFGGISNNTGFSCNTGSYTYFNSPVDTFYVGTDEDIDITVGDGGTENVYVWIDFNQNGTFDSIEYTSIGSGFDEVVSNSINIPANAQTGLTVMRVRVRWNSTLNANQACFNGYTYGETEDYLIYLAPTPPCITPVVAGVVNGPATVALDSVGTYVLTGFTGTNVRWQIATEPNGPYSTFAGVNNDSISIIFNATDTFYLRAFVTTIGCAADTSAAVQVVTPKRVGDDVCDAIPLTFGVNGPFSTSGATTQPGEVAPLPTGCSEQDGWCNSTISQTMWFKFVAPASGRVRVNAPGEDLYDTQLALWDASSCDSLLSATGATLLGANDDDDYATEHGYEFGTSYIDSAICLTPGKTYYVQLDPYSTTSSIVSTIILTDLGPGPVASFTNLDSTYCVNATPITLLPAGGTFTGTGVTGNTFSPAAAGVGGPYIISRNYYACYTYSDTVYAVNAAPSVTVDDTTDVSCHSGSNGAIAVTTTGGTTPYTFAWSNNGSTEDLTGLTEGTYTLTVTDANLCSATGSATVLQPDTLLPSLDSLINVGCAGDSNGAVYLTTQGGVLPYTFAWSNGASTEDLVGVPGGTYTLSVTDANNCTYVSPPVPISQPAPISIIVNSVTNLNCNGDANGAINITVTGGTPGYTYLWSNGVTTQDLTGLTAGTYTPTVTDSRGCVLVGQTFTITQPAVLAVTVDSTMNASCSTTANGAAYITVTGGTTPYGFNWSNSSQNEDLTGVVAGTYDVTVTDAKQCSATAQVTVNANAAVTATVDSVKDVTCANGSNGAVYITPAGGVAPYNYSWSNSTIAQDLINAGDGNYSVVVNDANGCSVTVTATIADGYVLNAVVDSTDDVSCNGGNNGAVYITETNGLAPYVYVWSNSGNTQDITGLAAGTYTLTLTDANGCVYSGLSATVNQATAIVLTSVVTDQIGAANNGAVNVTISGGTSPYTSVWSNSANTEDLTAIAAGVYTTTVTDANGCTAIKTDTVDFIVGISLVNGSYSVNMYPNPTAGVTYVDVKLDVANDVTVEVFNVAGQLVESIKEFGVTDAKLSLDLTQHAAGVYNTRITIGDKVITKRLIVNK